jgi:hypothetical protein
MGIITFPPSTVSIEVVATKTQLKNIDPNKTLFAYLLQTGVMGGFSWQSGDFTARVAADPREAVYMASNLFAVTVGCWVRQRLPRELELEWFEVFSGAVDNTAAVQAAINLSKFEAGGTIWCGGYYRVDSGIIQDGNDIVWRGRDRSSGINTITAGKQLWKVTGARHGMYNMLLVYQAFTSTNSDYCLWVDDAVQFSMQDCRVLGGYYPIISSGGACADNTYINCDFIYPTGIAQNYMVNGTGGGVNGAHHFIRCRFNSPYPGAVPTSSAQFKGVRANTTAYATNDVVSVGSYYLQAVVGGTTSGTAPTVNFWYGVNVVDGTVTWQLCSNTSLVGCDIDTGVSSVYINGCDITGPFVAGFTTNNRFAGVEPRGIYINTNTVHGPLNNGATINAGDQIVIFQLDSYGSIFKNGVSSANGIFAAATVTDAQFNNNNLQGFDNGTYFLSNYTSVTMSTVAGCTRGIRVGANTNNFRIENNTAAGTPLYGFNTTAIEVDAGTSDNYIISLNSVAGAGTGVSDGGAGANKTVANNR